MLINIFFIFSFVLPLQGHDSLGYFYFISYIPRTTVKLKRIEQKGQFAATHQVANPTAGPRPRTGMPR